MSPHLQSQIAGGRCGTQVVLHEMQQGPQNRRDQGPWEWGRLAWSPERMGSLKAED